MEIDFGTVRGAVEGAREVEGALVQINNVLDSVWENGVIDGESACLVLMAQEGLKETTKYLNETCTGILDWMLRDMKKEKGIVDVCQPKWLGKRIKDDFQLVSEILGTIQDGEGNPKYSQLKELMT